MGFGTIFNPKIKENSMKISSKRKRNRKKLN